MSETKEVIFEDLPIRHRALAPTNPNQYRVTSAFGEVKTIDSSTAYEAFKQSGFTSAVKIERVSNLDAILIEKSKFIDYSTFDPTLAFSDVTPLVNDPFEAIKLRKNPILSANELDELMHALQEMASSPAGDAGLVLGSLGTIADPSQGLVPGPTGIDVHGDGFDEIIPERSVKPMSTAKSTESQQAPEPSESILSNDLPPVKELTAEEVAQLLGGKSGSE